MYKLFLYIHFIMFIREGIIYGPVLGINGAKIKVDRTSRLGNLNIKASVANTFPLHPYS